MDNRFNLIDEAWIPVAGVGRVSLAQIFQNPDYRALGGNPVQKIALMKLLLAIAQAAYTPADEDEWRALGAEGLAEKCLAYLQQWHDRFYLYGGKPFLQMPAIEKLLAKRTASRLSAANTAGKKAAAHETGLPKAFGAGFYPDLPSENNTMLSQTMMAQEMADQDRAIFVVTVMNFAFGGKRIEADLENLSGVILGSRHNAAAGPSLGGWDGQLHCFPIVHSLLGSLWVNLLTEQNIQRFGAWSGGVGRPAWEEMPTKEADSFSNQYQTTYQAALLAISRFVLLMRDGVIYMDGIQYPKVANGWIEPSLLIDKGSQPIKVKYVDPNKKPWRELESLLAFNAFSSTTGFECFSLKASIDRLNGNFDEFTIWSGGIKVSSNSGDQSVKQTDDFVESQVCLRVEWITGVKGGQWFSLLAQEMRELDSNSRALFGCARAYFKEQKVDAKTTGKRLADDATQIFWQLCERDFQQLINHCEQGEINQQARAQLRRRFASYVQQAYDQFCPKDTARQLDAWAKCRPNLSKYLRQEV